MKKQFGSSAGLLAAALLSCPLHGAVATEGIQWNSSGDVVDAQIEGWPLPKVLGAIATSTGWQIYVEPDTRYTVSTRFRKLKPAEALRRLLGELNFALLPQTNGPAKFFVYRTTVHEATQLIVVP